jgi:CheY-like chemotaxis protein
MKKRILIVDDDKQLNKINERIIFTAGVAKEVHITLNGKEALDYLEMRIQKEYPLPDLIILDLNMPVMNGFEFLEAYQKLHFAGKSQIEIIIFTSSTSPKDREKALAKGIRYYLNKPYLLRELNDIIQKLNFDRNRTRYGSI